MPENTRLRPRWHPYFTQGLVELKASPCVFGRGDLHLFVLQAVSADMVL